jgi:hypothetical protein
VGLTAINRGNWQGRLMKPKTTFGRVEYGIAPPTLLHGFVVCTSDKTDGVKRCPLSGADYWAYVIG